MSEIWRIPKPIDVNHRTIVDTGGKPLCARLIARLIPSDNPDGLQLEEEWEDPDDGRWLPAIQSGIEQFTTRRQESGKPVGYTTLVMKRVISHPIDTDDRAVTYHVKAMLHNQFDAHETLLKLDRM
jgi:hypothetical protein